MIHGDPKEPAWKTKGALGLITWRRDDDTEAPVTAIEEPAEPAPTPYWYEPRLDVLRFNAFLCVFVSHNLDVSSFAPAWVKARLGAMVSFGLVLFFVLSAFLLTRLIYFEVEANGSFNLRRYFQRRILRIWPLYFAVLLLAVLAMAALSASPNLEQALGVESRNVLAPSEIPSFAFFFANWYLPLTDSPGNFLPHMWSLSVEEQFYLALPVLFVLSVRWRRFPEIVCLIGLIVTAWMITTDASTRLVSNATTTYAICFAAGLLLARSEKAIRKGMGRPGATRAVTISGIALWALYALLIPSIDDLFGYMPSVLIDVTIQTCLATIAIAVIISMAGRHLSGFQVTLAWLGKRSYGLYVFHWPILQLISNAPVLTSGGQINMLGFAVSGIATAIASILSYRYMELPFLRWRARLRTA